MIDGLAVVDKPPRMTSHDVVGRCRKIFAQKRVGHAGTLDPDATGVLLVGLGRATRLMQFMSGLDKTYVAEVVLGVATSTLDAAGEVTGRWDQSHVTVEQARQAARALTGPIQQVPPMVSAVKVGGRRLHELARAGIQVERQARPVTVSRFDIEASPNHPGEASGPVLSVGIDCSSGTYIRVLAADLGAALGGGAYVRSLRRSAVGPWHDSEAVPLDDLGADSVLPPSSVLPWLDRVIVDGEGAADVGHGKVFDSGRLGEVGDGPWAVIGPDGDLLAVYQAHGTGRVKPAVVLAAPSE